MEKKMKNYLSVISILVASLFLMANVNAQSVSGSLKNLYMIAELPLPKSDLPYNVVVFDKINENGSLEELNFDDSGTYEGNYTISLNTGGGSAFESVQATVLISGEELEFKKGYSVCDNESSQIDMVYKEVEKASDGYSEACIWVNGYFNNIQVYYAECDEICLDYTYNLPFSRFKSTDIDFLKEYSFNLLEITGGLIIGGNPSRTMDFEKKYIN